MTRTRCCSASIFNSASIAGLIRKEVVILPSSAFALASGGGAVSGTGDVFLAATARVFGLTLVTADPQLIACSWLKTLANE